MKANDLDIGWSLGLEPDEMHGEEADMWADSLRTLRTSRRG